MAINSQHPQYQAREPDWKLMRTCYEGERAVKELAEKLLPPTAGQELDGMGPQQPGRKRYDAYLTRASYMDIVEGAVNGLIGVMHMKPAKITLPERMMPLMDKATPEGEGLQTLLRRLNTEQLLMGRVGLLMDVAEGSDVKTLPYLATYTAETIINWDDGRVDAGLQDLEMVVLDETEHERKQDLQWEVQQRWRLLWKGPLPTEDEGVSTDLYRVAVLVDQTRMPTTEDMKTPSFAGKTLEKIPFMFIGDKDWVPAPGKPPLLALANLSVAIYRQDADYKQALHQIGQDTLVIQGGDTDVDEVTGESKPRTGGGAVVYVPTGGDAKFIGPESQGIPEMREAIQADKEQAAQMGGRMLEQGDSGAESGDALRIRVSAKTSSLASIAITGASALQHMLREMASWIGVNPEEVVVEPNLDFSGAKISATELVALAQAKSLGVPISWETIHGIMLERGMTSFDFEAELEKIQKETEEGIGLLPGMDGTDRGMPGDGSEQQQQETV